ncbi:MAG TPA: hypothetical protein PJ988_03740, partial [Anaerolinea sp.]|nr:hypothetical protein [Anaerolinea sp.]
TLGADMHGYNTQVPPEPGLPSEHPDEEMHPFAGTTRFSLASAMTDFANAFTDKLTATIVDGGGDGTWPIAGYTYLILHTSSMDDCVKAEKLLNYVKWSLTDSGAAGRAASLGYAVLPPAVQTTVLAKLGEVTCQGQPVLK